MKAVMFTFSPDATSEQQEAALERIKSWDLVQNAGRIKPDARSPEVLRMCYVHLDEHCNPEELAQAIRQLPQVSSADVPPDRGLV